MHHSRGVFIHRPGYFIARFNRKAAAAEEVHEIETPGFVPRTGEHGEST